MIYQNDTWVVTFWMVTLSVTKSDSWGTWTSIEDYVWGIFRTSLFYLSLEVMNEVKKCVFSQFYTKILNYELVLVSQHFAENLTVE